MGLGRLELQSSMFTPLPAGFAAKLAAGSERSGPALPKNGSCEELSAVAVASNGRRVLGSSDRDESESKSRPSILWTEQPQTSSSRGPLAPFCVIQ